MHASLLHAFRSPLFAVIGVALMAAAARGMLFLFPLLDVEKRAHKSSLPLDGLRGLLASSVLFHHAAIWFEYERTGHWSEPASRLYAQLGPAAVTVFFFVSGYLFWDKALKRPDTITWRKLVPNRVRRIFPAYWAAVVVILVSALAASNFHLHQSARSSALQAIEWFTGLASPNINGVDQEPLTASVFWTLRMEWVFYLLLPVMAFFRKWWQFALMVVVAPLLLLLLKKVELPYDPLYLMNMFRRFLQMFSIAFVIGMLAAYRPWGERVLRTMRTPAAQCFAVVCVCAELTLFKSTYTLAQSLLLAPLFFFVVAGISFGGLLTSRALRALGQISYSVYIFHGVLLFNLIAMYGRYHSIAAMNFFSYCLLIWGIGVIVAILCTLTYWWIERPFTGGALPKKAAVFTSVELQK